MSTVATLLTKIESFCEDARIAETTFGFRAVSDGKFIGRLKAGAGVTIGTIERVEAYIADQRKQMAKPKRRAA